MPEPRPAIQSKEDWKTEIGKDFCSQSFIIAGTCPLPITVSKRGSVSFCQYHMCFKFYIILTNMVQAFAETLKSFLIWVN